MSKILTLPSFFASYLVNNDATGLDDADKQAIDNLLASNNLKASDCFNCYEVGYKTYHDLRLYSYGSANCEEFYFRSR